MYMKKSTILMAIIAISLFFAGCSGNKQQAVTDNTGKSEPAAVVSSVPSSPLPSEKHEENGEHKHEHSHSHTPIMVEF
jgi:PBP1b-binding outer membrane lipoprotein LpoB